MTASTLLHGGRTRLAPTPSGYLHAGNAFNFLVTERLARTTGSTVVLRIDDLDEERARPEYIDDIFRSLEWLGIRCDEGPSGPEELARSWSQQHRVEQYQTLLDRLIGTGNLYVCACSRTILDAVRHSGRPHPCSTNTGPVAYGKSALRLRIPHPCRVRIRDVHGSATDHELSTLMDDPGLRQRDNGRPTYQLASLSDDLEMGITFIVRGVDLLPSSVCQAHVAALLGLERFAAIRFLHHPLINGNDGGKLSKSGGASSLQAMRAAAGPQKLIDQAQRFVDGLFSPSGP